MRCGDYLEMGGFNFFWQRSSSARKGGVLVMVRKCIAKTLVARLNTPARQAVFVFVAGSIVGGVYCFRTGSASTNPAEFDLLINRLADYPGSLAIAGD